MRLTNQSNIARQHLVTFFSLKNTTKVGCKRIKATRLIGRQPTLVLPGLNGAMLLTISLPPYLAAPSPFARNKKFRHA